jgi:NAD(P)-dependent dehydrogenase (short-subunit alcohol dehydrogenase family)
MRSSSHITSFSGQTALVTGAARGQGATIALALAEAGADIVLWDAPDNMAVTLDYPLATAADLQETADRIAGTGRRALQRQVDVRDMAAVELAFADALTAVGQVDLLVCAAGIRSVTPASAMTDAAWDDVLDTNLHGAYHTIRAALPHLVAAGTGRILVIAAEEGRRGAPLLSHYAAAAWALIGLTKSVAWELASSGISANALCTGPVDTAMSDSASFRRLAHAGRSGTAWGPDPQAREAMVEALTSRHPTGIPFVSSDAIAAAALYCLGQPLELTGSVIDVSLGLAAMNTA